MEEEAEGQRDQFPSEAAPWLWPRAAAELREAAAASKALGSRRRAGREAEPRRAAVTE